MRALTGLSDSMTSITARLDMMNDGLQTTEELNRMIYESAQRSRGSYQQTANLVAKLGTLAGDAFSSNREIIAFAEQLNKQMALSGTTTQEAQAAMLQLTQGLASGTLRGEELNSVLEQTPMIAQSIAKYMGVNTGEMRELASEGAITAGVVKSAMFAMADEINAKFEQMPMTWGAGVDLHAEHGHPGIAAGAERGELAGEQSVHHRADCGWAGGVLCGVPGGGPLDADRGRGGGAYHFVVNLLTIGFGVLRGSTAAASAAVMTFNSALFASPITWIIMLVGVLIGLLYAGVAAFNKLTGSSVSATGIITGTLATLAAFVFNSVLVPIQRGFASFANFLGNVFDNPVASVKLLFYDMALTVLGFIQNVAQGLENLINKIPGVEVNLTSGIDILYNKIAQGAQTIRSESGWKEYIKAWDYKDLADAFSGGYNWGSNLFSGSSQTSALDYTNTPTYSQVSGIADSVKGIEKSVNMSEEDIKALVDVAERRYVNNINLTAQTPVITINGANTGRTAADRQNLANAIRDILIEQVSSGSARTTARAF